MTTPSPVRPRGPRWLNPLVWVLLPVAILAALEVVIGGSGLVKSSWSRVEEIAREQKIEFLFVGTSRTWAAVNEDDFQAQFLEATGRDVRAVRAGIGNSTNGQHVRGIRNLLRAVPGALEDTVVLVESRAGIAGSERGADLRNDLGPGALEDVFRIEDVPELLTSDLGAESKAQTLVAWAAPPFRFLTFRSRFRRKLLERSERFVRRTGLVGDAPPKRRLKLAEGGGIRTDAAGAESVRTLVTERLARLLAAQEPLPWGEYDLLVMVERLHDAGAHVALLDIPLCTRDGLRWRSEVRQADAARLAALLAERGVGTVAVPLVFTESDFPDDLHVDLDSATRFSRALADECSSLETE